MPHYLIGFRPKNKKRPHLLQREAIEATNDITAMAKARGLYPELTKSRIYVQRLKVNVDLQPMEQTVETAVPPGTSRVIDEATDLSVESFHDLYVKALMTGTVKASDGKLAVEGEINRLFEDTAQGMFQKPLAALTPQERTKVKTRLFTVLYGGSSDALSRTTDRG